MVITEDFSRGSYIAQVTPVAKAIKAEACSIVTLGHMMCGAERGTRGAGGSMADLQD